jgi:glucose-6-phosphate 1-epimerase
MNGTELGLALAAGEVAVSATKLSGRSHHSFRALRSKMQTMSAVEGLERRFGIPGVARICEDNGGLPRIQITGADAQGEIYLHGAQVTSWKPAGNDEVLFLSTKSRWQEGQAIRGGIPICFPWFRAKTDDPRAPSERYTTA